MQPPKHSQQSFSPAELQQMKFKLKLLHSGAPPEEVKDPEVQDCGTQSAVTFMWELRTPDIPPVQNLLRLSSISAKAIHQLSGWVFCV